ncbi:hypothetical protein [Streptomyces albogriseolus]|uniref:hypothetical protein n=1 Tax=Streptomyces albogriseolus TaxID=1887 RepID=UPI0034606C87
MNAIRTAQQFSPDDIAATSWEILAETVRAPEADAECANCGYGLVALPRPIRLKVTAEGIGGGYLAPRFMDYAHWADDEERAEDAREAGFEACADPEPRECQGLSGTGCDGYVQPGEHYCGECLKAAYGD